MKKGQAANDSGGMGTLMTALAWVIFMVLLGFYFTDVLEEQRNPNRSLRTEYTQDQKREVTLQRNKFGHYVTSGKINGHPVVFLVDTGATGVAIPEHIARRLKIKPGRAFQVQTANGVATSYATRLNRVSVGEIELHDVDAGIVPGFKSNEILLGMSFLRHIEFTQKADTLILNQLL